MKDLKLKELCDIYPFAYIEEERKPFGLGLNELNCGRNEKGEFYFNLILEDVTDEDTHPQMNDEQFRLFAKMIGKALRDLNKEKKKEEEKEQ